MRSDPGLISKIEELKSKLNAVVLAHNYQRPEVQKIADFLGDSLVLAKKAMELDNPVIVFCGVHFMAESAKILSPDKKILLPEPEAGCPLADCASPEAVRKMRDKHPDALFIAYINTSAEVKAECDICVTSANAMNIIRHFPHREIVYLPDKNLARYAEKQLNREIIKWPGQCYVHDQLIQLDDVERLKAEHPEAVVMSHPETAMEILEISDVFTGTGGMLSYARSSGKNEFIVVTEQGLVDRMRREIPGKIFFHLPAAICGQMKLTTLRSLHESLRDMKTEITVDSNIASRAKKALDRMMELSG